MSGVLNFLTKIFGNKYDSDINKLKPIIENINAEVKSLSTLSNDELRDITRQLKLEIKENTLELNKKIDNLKKSIDNTKNENEAEIGVKRKSVPFKWKDLLDSKNKKIGFIDLGNHILIAGVILIGIFIITNA